MSLVPIVVMAAVISTQPPALSQIVMWAATVAAQSRGVAAEADLEIRFAPPQSSADLNWYSRMCLYNEKEISFDPLGLKGNGQADLSVYYTFGAFRNGKSLVHAPDSPYHNAFYGGYVVKVTGENQKSARPAELARAVSRYDYTQLILRGFGYEGVSVPFKTQESQSEASVDYCGYSGWTRMDGVVETLSVNHIVGKRLTHYIQFGKPKKNKQKPPFPWTRLSGRLYARYFEDKGIYVILYLLAPDTELIEKTNRELLSKTIVR